MNIDEHRLGAVAEQTLNRVRELSENAMLRPAPRRLRCVPVQNQIALRPVPAWKRDWIRIQELAALSRKLLLA